MNNTSYKKIWKTLQESKAKPFFFGLGFIQCKISSEERYHFYHSSLDSIVGEEEIHNHRYDFVSQIIKGKLSNKIYEFIEDESGLYQKEEESCNENIKIIDAKNVKGNIQLLFKKKYSSNEIYFMDNNTFHTIEAKNCITYLKRTSYKKEYAQVVRPIMKSKVCPFSKKISEERCWEIIKEMLEIREE